jgi:DNA-binding transcriptional LysR family regulator
VSITSIDLNLMLVLHTVLAERSVARAAERLHVTPSAVSNALARLRGAMGDPLVTRKGRGIVPTPRATELAPAIARAIREIELALGAAPFDAASPKSSPQATSSPCSRPRCSPQKGASLGLRPLVTSLPPHTTKFAMSWHERTHADPAARAFRTLVRRIVTEKRPKRA